MKKLTMNDLGKKEPNNIWLLSNLASTSVTEYSWVLPITPKIIEHRQVPKLKSYQQVKTKSDRRFLTSYLGSFHLYYQTELVAIKDTANKYLTATLEYAMLMGFNTVEGLINIGYSQKNLSYADYMDIFHLQDLRVVEQKQDIYCLNNLEYNGKLESVLCHKKPVINPDTGNVVAIRLIAQKPMVISPVQLFLTAHKIKKNQLLSLGNFAKTKINLTQRQHLVLFLTINRYSQGDIANFFILLKDKMSVATVASTLYRLRERFNVTNNEDLINKSIQLGMHIKVPQMLLKKGSFILNNHELEIKK